MSKQVHFSLSSGLIKEKMSKFKKTIIGAVASTALLAGFAVPTFAATPPAAGYCTASSTGCSTASSQTDCYGAGAFGAFGTYGASPHDFRGGANGTQTGINNSTLCGNPQN